MYSPQINAIKAEMKKAIITSATIVVTLGFMLLRDYHNYFYGKSFINYHLLPYGLTPEYYKDYVLENGKSVPIESFYLTQIGH